MADETDWKARALAAEDALMEMYMVLAEAVAGAGGRIVIHPHDLHKLAKLQLHTYERPESGAKVYELVERRSAH